MHSNHSADEQSLALRHVCGYTGTEMPQADPRGGNEVWRPFGQLIERLVHQLSDVKGRRGVVFMHELYRRCDHL